MKFTFFKGLLTIYWLMALIAGGPSSSGKRGHVQLQCVAARLFVEQKPRHVGFCNCSSQAPELSLSGRGVLLSHSETWDLPIRDLTGDPVTYQSSHGPNHQPLRKPQILVISNSDSVSFLNVKGQADIIDYVAFRTDFFTKQDTLRIHPCLFMVYQLISLLPVLSIKLKYLLVSLDRYMYMFWKMINNIFLTLKYGTAIHLIVQTRKLRSHSSIFILPHIHHLFL